MLTGIGETLNEMTSPLYGADAYLDKPFEFAELDEKVRGALTKRQASRPGLARTAPAKVFEESCAMAMGTATATADTTTIRTGCSLRPERRRNPNPPTPKR